MMQEYSQAFPQTAGETTAATDHDSDMSVCQQQEYYGHDSQGW